MATRNEKLNRLVIGSPCTQPWSAMQGDEKRRHCRECNRLVHDLVQLTPREIAGLVEASRGRLCGRITRDGAGRLVTGELVPPEASPAGSFRASPVAAAVVGGLLALSGGAASSQAPAPAVASVPGAPEPEAKPESARPQRPAAPAAVLSGPVIH